MNFPRFPIPFLEAGLELQPVAKLTHDYRMALLQLDALHITVATKSSEADAQGAYQAADVPGETPTDEWVAEELSLSAILAALFLKMRDNIVVPKLTEIMTAEGEAFDEASYRQALVEIRAEVKAETQKVIPEIEKSIASAMSMGEARVEAGLLDGSNSVPLVGQQIVNSTVHYADEFFTTYVVPAINREIEQTLSEGPLARPDLAPIMETIAERMDAGGDAYGRLVANAQVSRAFHYGLLKSGQLAGFTLVVFSAMMDDRTSEICEHLNGRQFDIGAMLLKYEGAAEAQTTEELQAVSPWFQRDKALPLDQDIENFLHRAGVPTPPLHGHCRSTLRLM